LWECLHYSEIWSKHGPSTNGQAERSIENGLGRFHSFLILHIWDKPDKLKWFQIQFCKLEWKPKKPRVLGFREIPCEMWSLSQATQRGHFQCFWKIYRGLSHELDVLGKIWKQIRTQRTKLGGSVIIYEYFTLLSKMRQQLHTIMTEVPVKQQEMVLIYIYRYSYLYVEIHCWQIWRFFVVPLPDQNQNKKTSFRFIFLFFKIRFCRKKKQINYVFGISHAWKSASKNIIEKQKFIFLFCMFLHCFANNTCYIYALICL
jgi:hypothetical protein